ncbi:MAG: histidinol-phosphate transaminase [Bacteroidota bacterium]
MQQQSTTSTSSSVDPTAIQSLVRNNIQQLQAYSSARSEFKGTASVFLDANENPFDTGFNRYPDPLQWGLKREIAAMKGIPAEQIFLGNGSDEAIDLLIRIFCEPRQDHIIILPPTYGMYRVSADIADVAVREVPLRQDFQPNVAAILEAADESSKMLFLCSPNNPTGNSLERELMRELLTKFPGIVVVDEAYSDFMQRESCLEWLEEFPNLVILQTFSKAWGQAGIRLGMAFAGEEVIGYFNKVKPPYNVNQLTQDAALMALENVEEKDDWVADIIRERGQLQQDLEGLDFVETVYPSDANFLLVKVRDADGLYDFLVREQIIVRNRSRVLLCEGCLRFTVGTEMENALLMGALQDYGMLGA